MSKDIDKMFEYEVWMSTKYEERWHTRRIVALTPGKAKYELFREVLEVCPDLTFEEFVKQVRYKKIGNATVQSLFTEKEPFDYMKEKRHIPFAYQGMRIEVDGMMGTIVGNYNLNLLVAFDGKWYGENCHPWWRTKYFDQEGKVVKEYAS